MQVHFSLVLLQISSLFCISRFLPASSLEPRRAVLISNFCPSLVPIPTLPLSQLTDLSFPPHPPHLPPPPLSLSLSLSLSLFFLSVSFVRCFFCNIHSDFSPIFQHFRNSVDLLPSSPLVPYFARFALSHICSPPLSRTRSENSELTRFSVNDGTNRREGT